MYGLSIGDKSGDLVWTLTYFFGGKNFRQRVAGTLFVRVRQNLATLRPGQSKLIPWILWTLVQGSHDTMQQHASVWYTWKVVFDNFPVLVDSLCSFYWLHWLPYVIGQTIIFSSCFFLLSSFFFFPRLISAVGNWMFTILWHMVWP